MIELIPEWLIAFWNWFPVDVQTVAIILGKIVLILLPLILSVAYVTYAERKIIGAMQVRIGPNRVGFFGFRLWGLGQPIADTVKLMFKEVIIPTKANKYLFLMAPILAIGPALAAWAVIPFDRGMALSNVNAGLLYVLALTSVAVYGVIIAGWASNSKYAIMSALRAGAQIVAYEIAMGFALVGVLMASGSLNLSDIVEGQAGGVSNWFFLPLLPMFFIYFISGVAETNRAPFDVAEGESEIVAGFHVEYSGMAFALFFLAEYANIILISALTSLMFMGGWLSPFEGLSFLDGTFFEFLRETSLIWLLGKMACFIFLFFWFRATFPRYRYDQIMRLGWKVFIPITILWICVEAVMSVMQWGPWAV